MGRLFRVAGRSQNAKQPTIRPIESQPTSPSGNNITRSYLLVIEVASATFSP